MVVDWSKYKGKDLKKSKESYAGLCELLHKNGHTLEGDYVNTKIKVLIDFKCGHEPHWIRPDLYKDGKGCPKCAKLCYEKAKEDLLELLAKNGHTLLSDYVNANTKVLIDFKCGHEPHWIIPYDYKRGHGCPRCGGYCPKKAKEDFLESLAKNGHTLLSDYVNTRIKVLIDFKCGHEPHWITPNAYNRVNGCPKCVNKGEGALNDLLITMFKNVECQKTYNDLKHKNKLSYDFYIPKYNLLIELDGEHHRKPVVYGRNTEKAKLDFQDRTYKDKLKNDYAKSNGIHLLRIEYNKGKIELDKWKQLILDNIKEIKQKNDRLALTMNKELHAIVKEYAAKENRKVSNFIINCVVEYLRNKYKVEI